jgi:hypothetical protein
MTSRNYLLADLEEKRRKQEEARVEVLSWELAPASTQSGYDPYDNPGAGKAPESHIVAGKKKVRKKR